MKRKEFGDIGSVAAYGVGADPSGWVEDWAVVKMKDGWTGTNGSWCELDSYGIAKVLNMKRGSKVKEGLGPNTCVKGGEIVAKDGASTGITGGIVNGTCFYMYQTRGRIFEGRPEFHTSNQLFSASKARTHLADRR